MKRYILFMIALTCFICTISGQSTSESNNDNAQLPARHLVITPNSTQFLLCQTFTVTLVTPYLSMTETFTWLTSDNLEIVSGQGSLTVTVKTTGLGPAWVRLNNNQDGVIIQYVVNLYVDIFISTLTTIYNNYTTTGDLIMPESSYISGTFIVEAGHTVTIRSTVYCTPNASIIIRAGGKLILEGGTLTCLCPSEMWRGITVLGSYSELAQNPRSHGTLEMIKSSIVNARTAIYVNDERSRVGTGGIVTAEYSTFTNNLCVVDYHPYKRYDRLNNEIDNLSYFSNCRFIIDDNNNFDITNSYNSQLVKLNGVKGIKFRGCEFSNNMSTALSRGTAIYAYNANFLVNEYCPIFAPVDNCGNCGFSSSVRSTFNGFGIAIDATNGGEYNFNVDHTDFRNNIRSISISGVHNFQIIRSNFYPTAQYAISKTAMVLYISNCYGYKVEENNFSERASSYIGIYLNDCYSNDMIYRNTFSGLRIGIYVTGGGLLYPANPELQFMCNDFSRCNNDISIATSGFIRQTQGEISRGADNKFSSGANCNFCLSNTQNILYFHSDQLRHYPTITTGSLHTYPHATANSCRSTICRSISIEDEAKGEPEKHSSDYDNYVEMSKLYNENINSFYNANYDYVINSFIEDKDNQESEALFYEALKKQSEISELSDEMSLISSENIRTLLSSYETQNKELQKWYNTVSSVGAKYSLVESYWAEGSYEKAKDALDRIPYTIELSGGELYDHENYVHYNNFRSSVLLSGRVLSQLNDEEIAELRNIADKKSGLASALAQGTLCFYYNICSEDIEKGDMDLLGMQEAEQNIDIKEVSIFPNPTKGDLSINAGSWQIKAINIMDITGKVIMDITNINNNEAQININELTGGIYLIEIITDNGVISDKIIKR